MKRLMINLVLVLTFIGIAGWANAIEIQDGDKMAILLGGRMEIWEWAPSGFLRLLTDELKNSGINRQPWLASNNRKTGQMLEHLETDVIEQHPIYALIVPLSADYNAFAEKVPNESFTNNLGAIIEKLKAANIKVIIATSYAAN